MARERHLFLLPLALAVALGGCDDGKKPARPGEEPPLPPRPARLDAGFDVESTEAVDAAAAARQLLAELRQNELDLAARRVPTQRIAFGKDRLARLSEDALVVHETKSWKIASKLPVTEPRRVVTASDGSLVVATKNEVVRVQADLTKSERFSRLPLFVDSLLFADKRDKQKLWVLHGIDPTLYPYELGDSGRLEALDFMELPSFDQKGFAALKDGSFVYTAGSDLKRFFPGGKTWTLRMPEGAEVWRILTTRRIDQLFLARVDGVVQLVQLASDRLTLVKTLELSGAFDIASNDSELAILRLDRAASAPVADGGSDADTPRRAWTLAVFDSAGKPLMSVALPLDAASGSDDDWVREITKNRAVVLSSYAPIVAVGGPTWLAAWDVKSGRQLLTP